MTERSPDEFVEHPELEETGGDDEVPDLDDFEDKPVA
jgi:hypothetical protein